MGCYISVSLISKTPALLNGDGSRPDSLREGHGIEKINQIDLQILLDTEMMRNLDIGLVIISDAIAIDYPASVTREVCFPGMC